MIVLPGVPTIRANRAMRRDRDPEPELPRDKPVADLDALRVATADPQIARHEPTEHQQVGVVSRLYRKSLVSGEVDFARQMELRARPGLARSRRKGRPAAHEPPKAAERRRLRRAAHLERMASAR